MWAIASNGDALIRRNVSEETPAGISWDHISSHEQLVAISCNHDNCVWAIGKNGNVLRRIGISSDNPQGESWTTLEPPKGCTLKQISSGVAGVWAVDSTGQVAIRREICQTFPEGTHWQVLSNVLNDPPHEEGKVGFRSVSVNDSVWAVSISGFVCKRSGITAKNPAGTGWTIGLKVRIKFFHQIYWACVYSHDIYLFFLFFRQTLIIYVVINSISM